MKNINELLATINLCDNDELEILTSSCNKLLKERQTAARNALRQELEAKLQQTINAILCNDFTLTIENSDDPNWAVRLNPDDLYHIEIE